MPSCILQPDVTLISFDSSKYAYSPATLTANHLLELCLSYVMRETWPRQVAAHGGDSLQIWRVATCLLRKPTRTPDTGCSSSLRAGREPVKHRSCFMMSLRVQ
jgi:hypothetical protein